MKHKTPIEEKRARTEEKEVEASVPSTDEAKPKPRGMHYGKRIAECLEALASLLTSMRIGSPWLTIPEAERYARCANGALKEAIARGELPRYQRTPGSLVLIDKNELNDYIHRAWRVSYTRQDAR